MSWRRISDWKIALTLVRVAEVPLALMRDLQLVLPADRIRDVAPRLAELAASTSFARVEPQVAEKLSAAGITLWQVGYHRGSDGMLFAMGPERRDLEMTRLVALLLDDRDDDEAFDRLRDDAVDAVLRVLSEGEVTERAVLIAALLPPLSAGPAELDAELAEHERDGGAGLPEVSQALVDQVAAALAKLESMPRQPPGPQLSAEARRRYIKQSAIVGGVASVLSLVALHWAPWIAVFASPVIVICLTAIAIHALALRQR
ncbi:MAG: hypothetical protein JST54_25485 [Deltaproteobacteria bacterium]|nr:hypothetical protein [Deltaproteobacteria bacterium]